MVLAPIGPGFGWCWLRQARVLGGVGSDRTGSWVVLAQIGMVLGGVGCPVPHGSPSPCCDSGHAQLDVPRPLVFSGVAHSGIHTAHFTLQGIDSQHANSNNIFFSPPFITGLLFGSPVSTIKL